MYRHKGRKWLAALTSVTLAISTLSPMTVFAEEDVLPAEEEIVQENTADDSELPEETTDAEKGDDEDAENPSENIPQQDVDAVAPEETDDDTTEESPDNLGWTEEEMEQSGEDTVSQETEEEMPVIPSDQEDENADEGETDSYSEETVIEEEPELPESSVTQEEELLTAILTEETKEAGGVVTDYASFLESLKVLEGYADNYALANGEDAVGLVMNYIRTGIDKYNTDSWAILSGAENTAFTDYVEQQDEENSTNAKGLRGIGSFVIPNGQTAEFSHMFGAMSIAYYNSNATASADFGSWAGDICDLMDYTKGKLIGSDVEAMALEIRENYLGIDDENAHSFGYLDIYGDLDSFYIINRLTGGSEKLSSIMEEYFTESLTDVERAVFFLTNRFGGNADKAEIRSSLYDAYKGNSGVILLEADRGLTSDDDLRTACCYAFADYLYDLAKDELGGQETDGNPYYSVFSSDSSTLAPGITQDIKYALTADEKQIVYYIATVDVNREDVGIYANYHENDGSSWAMSRVTDQMAAAQAKHSDPDDIQNYIPNYNPIVGVNADFYDMTNGAPSGALVMEGVEYHSVGSENFFGILKDGTPVIGGSSEWNTYKDQIQEAVGGSVYLVKDGKIAVTANADYYNSRASRTCVGITKDGRVVLMVLDGRQEPFSAGGSAEEIAQIMLEAGCDVAINLDGGGSSTFAAKEEGDDEVTVVNRPSDGYERSVSSSLLVVSTAKTSNEFDHALLTTDTDYLTIGTSLTVSVSGVSESGNTAEIPEDAALRISDDRVAVLNDGVITAVAAGDVNVELVIGDTIAGSTTLHVVVPDGISFEKKAMNAIYGVEAVLPLTASYKGNPVSINPDDISFELSSAEAGTMEGFAFIGNEESGVRTVTVTASLAKDLSVHDEIQIALYKNGEAIFDFDNATEGDQSFAWNRDVSNSTTTDEKYYHIADPNQEMNISYIFALDMKEIEIPEQIKPLIALLPGGDSADATAWDFLLQLAERVSVMTEVRVQLHADPNLAFDFSEMTLVNEYFIMTSKEYNEETHTLTVVCNWIDQTQAIDPATANPICILSGIKAIPKEDAQWDENDCLQITNSGDVSYDIYLRSSTLYNVAGQTNIQETYGLYPFVNPNDSSEKGAHFGTTYATFEDNFTLDKSVWQGWKKAGDDLYYYADNVPVTGIRKVPGYEDEKNSYYYRFNENGVCQGKVTGLFELDGDLYYAINGASVTGWRMVTVDGEDRYYFFDTATGKAVDGEQTIYGYDYVFTDHVLTRGALVSSSSGIHYKWAGEWIMNSWVEIDGNKYYAGKAPYGYFITSLHMQIHKYGSNSELGYCLFDENGVWQEDYSGLYIDDSGDTYLIESGYLVEGAGLVYLDGYYYYFRTSSSTAVKDRTYWITVTNDLLPVGQYAFDKDGKMINPPENPDPDPTKPDPEIKNGIVSENGSLYYYVDGVLTGAGLIQIDGDYYYVRTSNGEVIHGRTYWATATNDLLPSGQYTFAEDGRMIDPPVIDPGPDQPEPEVKNGIVAENGSLFYYVDGVLTGAGLFRIDGDYYYAKTSNGEIVHGRTYWITKTNDLLPEKIYTFDETGKIVL